MKEYIIPIGVDGEQLIKPLDDAISKMEQVENKAKEAGKEISEGFGKGAAAATDIERKLKPIEKGLDVISAAGKAAGIDVAEALSGKKIDTASLGRAVADFKKKLEGLKTDQKINVKIDKAAVDEVKKVADYMRENFSTIQGELQKGADDFAVKVAQNKENIQALTSDIKNLEDALQGIAPGNARSAMESELRAASQALAEEKVLLQENSNAFKEADTAAKNLAQGIAEADKAVDTFNKTQQEAESKGVSLKREMRNLKEEIAAMELAGEAGSKKFMELSARAAELEDQIGDTNTQIKILSSDTARFDALISGVQGLVGGFTAAQGAIALFADENEDLQKALLKVNAAMAVLQGLQQVSNTLNKDSAFNVIFMRKARVADAAATDAQAAATAKATTATKIQTVATKGLGLAFKALGIGLVVAAIAYLIEYWDELTASVNKLLPAGQSVSKMFDTLKAVALGVGNAILQYLITPVKALYLATQGEFGAALDAIKNGFNVVGNFQTAYHKQSLRNEEKYELEREQQRINFAKRELERRKNRGEDVYKLEQRLAARQMALNRKTGADNAEIQKEYEDAQDKRVAEMKQKQEAAAKKREADAKAAAAQAKQRAAEAAAEAKKQAELVYKYTQEINALRVDAMAEGYDKERAVLKAATDAKIADLEKEEARTAAAVQKRTELIVALRADEARKLAELNKKQAQEEAVLRAEGQKMLAELSEESVERELKLLELEASARTEAVKEQYKNEAKLRDEILQALEGETARKRQEINLKYQQKEIQDEEAKAVAILELMRNQQSETIAQEEQYQLALLEVKKAAAVKTLEALIASGKNESDIEVINAKLKIKQFQDAIDEQLSKGKKFDLFKMLGIGQGWSKTETDAVKAAATELLSNISQITDAIVEQYQRQIDKRQEVIDQIDGDISNLEQQLDKEKDLREKGFANNVEVIQKELEAKKAQRAEELRQQQELQKQQEQIKRRQIAADSAIQLVNMITSSTEIYKSLAPLGPFGIGLAIATIATMFGSFAATKIKAMQATQTDKQLFRGGGWIDGPAHEQGGVKYYGPSGAVRELEGSEFVTNKKSARRYAKLLEATNSGDFSKLAFYDLETMGLFDAMGISLSVDNLGQISETAREAERGGAVIIGGSGYDFRSIDDNIAYLADSKRNESETWEDAEYFYRRTGNIIKKYKKR